MSPLGSAPDMKAIFFAHSSWITLLVGCVRLCHASAHGLWIQTDRKRADVSSRWDRQHKWLHPVKRQAECATQLNYWSWVSFIWMSKRYWWALVLCQFTSLLIKLSGHLFFAWKWLFVMLDVLSHSACSLLMEQDHRLVNMLIWQRYPTVIHPSAIGHQFITAFEG